MIDKIKEYITAEQNKLERSIIATPASMKDLDAFATANNGANDVILQHMAIQFGYKMAMQAMEHQVNQVSKDSPV